MKKISHILLCILMLMLIINIRTFSLTITSTKSGNWSAPTTWGGNPIPTTGDIVIINGDFTVTVDVSNAVCSSVQLGGSLDNTGDGTLLFTNGSHLMVSGVVTFGVDNRKGNIDMSAGGTLTCGGFVLNSHGLWEPGTGNIEFTSSNFLPNSEITNFNNLVLSGGITTLTSNITVSGNLVINAGGTLDGAINSLTLFGNWTNNGTFTGNAGTVIFEKDGNQIIEGEGLNNFNLIRLNMGTSNTNILEVQANYFTAPDAFLILSGGTFKISGNFPLTSTFFTGPDYNIPPTSGLWLNNPNVTVTAQAGGMSLRGMLRITSGTLNIGASVDHNLTYVTDAVMIIEGGLLNVAGNLAGNNATAFLSYNQSGGMVNLVTRGSTDPGFGGFDMSAPGSSCTVSGGFIVIANATSGPADYINLSSASNVTGGTLQIGNEETLNAQTIRINTLHPVGNFILSGATTLGSKPVALLLSDLDVTGDISLEQATTLNANGRNISLGSNWTNEGIFIPGSSVIFYGPTDQGITAPDGVQFNNLTINKTTGTLTLNSSVTVDNAFTLGQGNLEIANNVLLLNGIVNGFGTLSSDIAGTVHYNQASDGQSVLPGNYGNLIFNNFSKTLASAGVTHITGTFSPGMSSGHTIAGSTIEFNGASQEIPGFVYFNLILGGSGNKTNSETIIVTGNFTNNAGIDFSGIFAFNLAGSAGFNNGTMNTVILTVGTGSEMVNNGILSVDSLITGPGTLTQGPDASLNIGGSCDIVVLNSSTVGNTVDYAGEGQEVKSTVYHNLSFSGTGEPGLSGLSEINGDLTLSGALSLSAASDLIVRGDIIVGNGNSFNAGEFNHSLAGNLIISGTFSSGGGSIFLNGSSNQLISGQDYFRLFIDNPAGISFEGDAAIADSLVINNGFVTTGETVITLAPDAWLTETEGHTVVGNISITRDITAVTGTEQFGNIGAEITLNGIAPGNTTVFRKTGIASTGGGRSSIKRYFDIEPATNSGLNAGLAFRYDPSELNGHNPDILELYSSQDEGTTWINHGGLVNNASHTITIAGIDEMSRWTASDTLNRIDGSDIPSSIGNPLLNKSKVILYPNPARGTIFFSETLKDFEVLDVYGRTIISDKENSDHLAVDMLSDGIYFMRTGNQLIKFMIKH